MIILKKPIESGTVAPVVDSTYPLLEVREAIRYLEETQAQGKLVITVRYTEQRSNYESRETRREDYAIDGHALTSSTTAS